MIDKNTMLPIVASALLCLNAAHAEKVVDEKKNKQNQPKSAEVAVPPEQKHLILVNGEALTSQSYISFLQSNPSFVSRAATSEEGKADALRELVGTQLLKKALVDEGLLKLDKDRAPSQKEITEAYEKLAEEHFPVPPKPDEKAVFEYYQSHQDQYGIPAVVRLNEIYIKHPDKADKVVVSAAKEKAEKALKRLESGENFSDIATEMTDNPVGKVTRGDIGFQQAGDIPWLKKIIGTAKKGERSGIIKTPTGFLILEVTDSRPALISPYANVRDKVVQALRDEGQKRVRDAYMKELAKTAKIEMVDPDISRLFPNGVFP